MSGDLSNTYVHINAQLSGEETSQMYVTYHVCILQDVKCVCMRVCVCVCA